MYFIPNSEGWGKVNYAEIMTGYVNRIKSNTGLKY